MTHNSLKKLFPTVTFPAHAAPVYQHCYSIWPYCTSASLLAEHRPSTDLPRQPCRALINSITKYIKEKKKLTSPIPCLNFHCPWYNSTQTLPGACHTRCHPSRSPALSKTLLQKRCHGAGKKPSLSKFVPYSSWHSQNHFRY